MILFYDFILFIIVGSEERSSEEDELQGSSVR